MSAFHYAVKVVSYYFHVSFLETCKSHGLCSTGLIIRKKFFIEFESDEEKIQRKIFWKRDALVYVKGCSALKKSFGISYINWKRILTMKTLRNG